MFRLRTLGQLDLRDVRGDPVHAVLVQPKRVALLVHLAVVGRQGFMQRDLLLSMFWPELPEARARNALRQALHQLRQSLGDVIVSRGTNAIRINEAVLWCDAAAFETSLDVGAIADASSLYGGDLLPGFGFGGASDFQSWLDDTRARLRARAARAAWALAEQRAQSGAIAEATECARRAAALTEDEGTVRQLVALLGRLGDVAGAVTCYEEFAHRLRRDFDLEPRPETTALLDAVRGRGAPPPPIAVSSDLSSRRLATAGWRAVVVTPFANLTGNAADDFVGRLMSESIMQAIAESRLVDVRDSAAGLENTDDLINVSGSYFVRDDAWCVQATVRGGQSGPVLGTIGDVTRPRARPWEAAEELRQRVNAILAAHLDPRFASWAAAASNPPSIDAQRELALGVELHLQGAFRAAIPRFLRAADAPTAFTMALLWAMQASCNLEEYDQAQTILTDLTARRAPLSPFEKLGCDYFAACLSGDRTGALRAARLASELLPDSEVLSQFGREAIFCNQPRLAASVLERLDPERGWIPAWTPYWRRLTEAYHMLGDHGRELDAARRGRAQHPEAISTLLFEARAHAALGDLASVDRCVNEAAALPRDRFADVGDVFVEVARELCAHGHPLAGASVIARALDWYADQRSDHAESIRARVARGRAFCDAGHWHEARDLFESPSDEQTQDVTLIGYRGVVAAHLHDASSADAALAKLRSMTGSLRLGRHLAWCARIAAVVGDRDGAINHLRGALARGYCHGIELHADPELRSLNGHAGFEEILRPKG